MKYVDPNLIIYIIKSAQQFLSSGPQSGKEGWGMAWRQLEVILMLSRNVIYLGCLSFLLNLSVHIYIFFC